MHEIIQEAIIEIYCATNDNDTIFLFSLYYKIQTKIEIPVNLRVHMIMNKFESTCDSVSGVNGKRNASMELI